MKKFILFAIFGLSIFSFFFNYSKASLPIFTNNNEIIYCKDSDDCSLEKWTQIVKIWINDIEKNRKASVYIQDIVKYLLTFITVIAVIYVIYAWFKILTSAWNEDEVKKSKTTILSVLVWIVIIWLAYWIVRWILLVINPI